MDHTGWIVRATAGRDKEGLFCVLGHDEEQRLLLCDGKRRRVSSPKQKKLGHVEVLEEQYDHPALQKLRRHEPVTDNEIRRALAAFRAKEV